MEQPVGEEETGGVERFVYFVIRVRRGGPEAGTAPTGVLERLGSGRARRFEGAQELLEMLTDGADGTSTSRS